MNCDLDNSLPDWLIEHPESKAVFDELGLDVHCGGKSLEYLCEVKGLNPEEVLLSLKKVINPQM